MEGVQPYFALCIEGTCVCSSHPRTLLCCEPPHVNSSRPLIWIVCIHVEKVFRLSLPSRDSNGANLDRLHPSGREHRCHRFEEFSGFGLKLNQILKTLVQHRPTARTRRYRSYVCSFASVSFTQSQSALLAGYVFAAAAVLVRRCFAVTELSFLLMKYT
jgi:hypothetical protein